MADNVLSILVRMRADGVGPTLDTVAGALSRVERRVYALQMAETQLSQAGNAMLIGAGGIAVGLGGMARSFAGVDREMRNVNTIAKLSEPDLEKLRLKINAVAGSQYNLADRLQVTQSIYDVMSVKGYSSAMALEVVNNATMLATAGQEDLGGATRSTLDILTAYHRTAPGTAKAVTDELYQAVQIGRFRLEELTGEIGPAMSVSASMGVDEKEVLAGLAVMTNKGFAVSEAATAIERTMTSALKPSKEFTAAAKDMGYESTAALVRAKGLTGALDLLAVATKGDETALAAVFPNVRALRGAMALGGESAADFAAAQDDLANSSGAAARAAAEQMNAPAAQWDQMMVSLKSAGQDLGSEAIPEIIELMHAITGVVKSFQEWTPEQRRAVVVGAEWTAGLLLAGGLLSKISGSMLGIIRMGTQWKEVVGALAATAPLAEAGGAAAAGAAAEVVVAASGRKSRGKRVKGAAGGVSAAAETVADLADNFGGRDFAAEEAALDAEWEREQLAWQKKNGGLAYQFDSQRNLRKERRGVLDTKAARSAKAFSPRDLMGAEDVVIKAGRAEVAAESKALARVMAEGGREVGGAFKSMPKAMLNGAKGGGGDMLANMALSMEKGAAKGIAFGAPDIGMKIGGAASSLGSAVAGAGPAIGVAVAAAVAAVLVALAANEFGAMRQDQKAATDNIKQEGAAQTAAADAGRPTPEAVAKQLGYSENQWRYGKNFSQWVPGSWGRMKDKDYQKINAEYLRQAGAYSKFHSAQLRSQRAQQAQSDPGAAGMPTPAIPTPNVPSRPQNVSSAAFGLGDQRQFVTVPVIINGENRRQILRTIDQRLDQVLVPA